MWCRLVALTLAQERKDDASWLRNPLPSPVTPTSKHSLTPPPSPPHRVTPQVNPQAGQLPAECVSEAVHLNPSFLLNALITHLQTERQSPRRPQSPPVDTTPPLPSPPCTGHFPSLRTWYTLARSLGTCCSPHQRLLPSGLYSDVSCSGPVLTTG